MNGHFRISSLLVLSALLRRAGLPAVCFQQEKIHATTAELFALLN